MPSFFWAAWKRAADAESAPPLKYKQVKYMSMMDKSKPTDGIISGVTEWGIFIEIIEQNARAWFVWPTWKTISMSSMKKLQRGWPQKKENLYVGWPGAREDQEDRCWPKNDWSRVCARWAEFAIKAYFLKFKIWKPENWNLILSTPIWKLLNSLSAESKRELISKLSDSLKSSKKDNPGAIKNCLVLSNPQSAEQIISDLKQTRTFTRNTEKLWKKVSAGYQYLYLLSERQYSLDKNDNARFAKCFISGSNRCRT